MVNEMKRAIFALLLFPVVAHAQCVETRDSTGDVISRSCVTKPLSAQDLNTLNDLAAQSQQKEEANKLADQKHMEEWEKKNQPPAPRNVGEAIGSVVGGLFH